MGDPEDLDRAPCRCHVGVGRSIPAAAVVRYVIDRANQAQVPVRLQVLKANPARRFYERLGFKHCGETDSHFQVIRERGAA